jgi:hypothetical protein
VDPARSGLNFYAYCDANPLNFVDPYGLCAVRNAASDALSIYGAYLQGLGQGGLNLAQGLQDTAVDLANGALNVNNPVMQAYTTVNGPLFSSPQWARNVLAEQSDLGYGASKFLTSQGALLLLGAGEAQLLKGVTKGMANPSVRAAANMGNKVHYDVLNGGAGRELPTALSEQFPDTMFRFARRGQRGADVEVVGGRHPSDCPGSFWKPNNKFGDFKPNSLSGHDKFAREIRNGKLEPDTEFLSYDPKTGKPLW